MEPVLAGLRIRANIDAWSDLGFATTGDTSDSGTTAPAVDLGGVRLDFADANVDDSGIGAWSFAGDPAPDVVDGLAVDPAPLQPPASPIHPNGIEAIDHVVVMTPDLDRTVAAFDAAGLAERRRRDMSLGPQPGQQVFFVVGTCIIELVGPVDPSGDGPATFWGLALTATDLDATAAHLGDRASEPKTAVQPGRRITTISRSAGLGVAVAVLSARS